MQIVGLNFVNDIYSLSSYEPKSFGTQSIEVYEIFVIVSRCSMYTWTGTYTRGLCIVK